MPGPLVLAGIAAAVVVVVAIVLVVVLGGVKWKPLDSTSLVYGRVDNLTKGSNDGAVVYLGDTPTAEACAAAASADANYKGYSWVAPNGESVWNNKCYGVKNITARVPQVGISSGERENYATNPSRGTFDGLSY